MRCGWAPQAVPYIVLQTPEVDISYSDYIISLLLVRSAANADEFYGLVALYKSQITNTTTAVAPISGCVCLLSVSLPSYICVMSDKCWWLRLAWQLQTLPVQHSHPICLPPPVPPSIPPIPSETPWLEQSVCLTHRTSVCFASVYKFVVVVEWHSFACRTVSGCVGLRLAWRRRVKLALDAEWSRLWSRRCEVAVASPEAESSAATDTVWLLSACPVVVPSSSLWTESVCVWHQLQLTYKRGGGVV